ncbi:DUF1501 domain-containing protein [soil metagenome]
MPEHITRRDFLRLAGIGTGAIIGAASAGGGAAAATSGFGRGSTGPARRRPATPVLAERLLVVLELNGGNDGMSMAPPPDSSVLQALRPSASYSAAEYLRPGGGVVLHPALSRMQNRPLTLVDGLGTPEPDLSHFEMMRRWRAGDPAGKTLQTTGFLGRVCDALDDGAPVTGLSIGAASTPALNCERAGTLGLPKHYWFDWLDDHENRWIASFGAGLSAMGSPNDNDGDTLRRARRELATGLQLGDMALVVAESADYPETNLGANLALASQLLDADIGIRIVHVAVDGDYDTHESHRDRHNTLLGQLNDALDTFLADLEARGLAERVLVATTSEFGRRPKENGNGGLDHGTASTALLAGPVARQRVGELPSFTNFDDHGNFVATVSMDRYYATLAESWFGVPASEVLAGSPRPIEEVW